jgi:hypothetical protein
MADDVIKTALKNKRDYLKGQGCQIIATVGGLFVNTQITTDHNNVPFVSLVGNIPDAATLDQNCFGGVSLKTWESNADRVNLLRSLISGLSNSDIYLYHDDGTHSQDGPQQSAFLTTKWTIGQIL